MQKQVEFCHSEGIVMLKFECALPNVANMCLHSSTSANFILSHKTMTICFQNFGKLWLDYRQWCLHVKLLLTKLTCAMPQVFANRLLECMLVNVTLTQCVNRCLQDSTQNMNLMHICKSSSPVRTNLEVSKYWSCPTFNEWVRTSELIAFTQQEFRKWWLFQCRWVLWTLQHSFQNNGLFLSLLCLSRGTTCSRWRWHSR